MVDMCEGIVYLPSLMVINIFLFPLVTVRGEPVLNPDGSITLPTENITVSGDQSDLILTINITLPNDTVSVENVMVFAYTDYDIGGRLISRPVNTSGTTQASPESQMVRRFKLETANVTLTSQLTKNSTTNRFKVRAMFKIALTCSTLYRQSYVIRKIVFVVTSRGKDDRQNEQQYLILYSKSVVPSPISTIVAGASSSIQNTGRALATGMRFPMPRLNINALLAFCCASTELYVEAIQGSALKSDGAVSLIQLAISDGGAGASWPAPREEDTLPHGDADAERYFSWCDGMELFWPVLLSLSLGWTFVYFVMSFMARGEEQKAILAMSVLAVFVENLLYSSVFVDSLDFAYNLMQNEAQSGWIVGIHKMGTSVGTFLVFCMFTMYPEIWRYRGFTVMLVGFCMQCAGGMAFGLSGLANVYLGTTGKPFDRLVLVARFLQGTGGGLQVAFGLMQTAMLLTGLERSIQNTRFYLGACLGMGTGPLLSSLSTSTARLAHCHTPPGYEATFAVCTLLPLIQLPMLRLAPKRVEPGEESPKSAPVPYNFQRIVVIVLCVILQAVRSFCSAAVEAALSQLLYTEYQWSRRQTGIVTAALMFTMLPAQVFYEQLGRYFSVNRAIRFLLLIALVGSSLNLFDSLVGLISGACVVLPSLALSSGLIMGTMQVHTIPESYIFDLNGTTLLSLILSDLFGRGVGPIAARQSIASGGQHGFGEQQLLVSGLCIVLYELVHVYAIEKQGEKQLRQLSQ